MGKKNDKEKEKKRNKKEKKREKKREKKTPTKTLNDCLPLEQPSDFVKTRFRRFPTFHFSTPGNLLSGFLIELRQFLNVFRLILKSCTLFGVCGICSMKNYTM